jgi:hypothetical protein
MFMIFNLVKDAFKEITVKNSVIYGVYQTETKKCALGHLRLKETHGCDHQMGVKDNLSALLV